MKFAKTLSIALVFVMIFTVGAVYAGWNYFQGEAAGTELTKNPVMAELVTNGKKGSIHEVTGSNNLLFQVDDTGSYVAGFTGAGSVKVKFIVNSGADADVITSGIKLKATITIKGTPTKYRADNGTDVFILAPAITNSFELNGGNKCANNVEIEITAAQILACLTFCEGQTVTLDTHAEFEAFELALTTYTIAITISEVA
ncbi:MAG: hypothetical protein IKD26_02740 [Clostridia bacterium]|nr:hypothetical protein [Clostridia bacterium]